MIEQIKYDLISLVNLTVPSRIVAWKLHFPSQWNKSILHQKCKAIHKAKKT